MTLLSSRLRQKVRVVRRVTVSSTAVATIDSTVGSYLPGWIAGPKVLSGGSDGSPRGAEPASTLYHVQLPTDLHAGDRVELQNGAVHELLSDARPLRHGLSVEGYEAAVLPLALLFPFTADLKEQGGDAVQSAIPISLWSVGEHTTDQGDYYDFQGEAPIDFATALKGKNRVLNLGGRRLRIVGARAHLQAPHVALQLREA